MTMTSTRRFEPYDIHWCLYRRRKLPTSNLINLIRERAIGVRKEGTNFIKGSREFYQTISIKRAEYKVERPQFFPLRFTPDGKKLVGIHSNFQEILLFTYRGCQFGAQYTSQQLFNVIFPTCTHVQFWNPRENPRSLERVQFGTLSRDCSFITPDSRFLIVSALIPVHESRSIFDGIVQNNESLEPDAQLMNITFYCIDMKKAKVIDRKKFEFDEINVQTGIYLLEWILAILSVQHQIIHIFCIDKQSGEFILLKQIGPSVLDDDELWLSGGGGFAGNVDHTFTGFRQRLLTFLYKEHSKNGQTVQFLHEIDYYRRMKMQKLQFVGPDILLIRMDIHPRKGNLLAAQHYMFVLFEWRSGKIAGVYDHMSETLFTTFIRYNEDFKNGHLVNNHFPTSMEHCGTLQERHDYYMSEQSYQNLPETRRRILNFLPCANTQHFVSSPYFDPLLFSYDEQLITYMQIGRFPLDQPLKLFNRKTKSLHLNLEFHDHNTTRVFNSCYARVLFHPCDPFVISISRGHQPDTLISFFMHDSNN